MWNVRDHVMFSTVFQKYVFDHNFWTKALRMTILVSMLIYVVKVMESDGVIYFDL